MAFKFHLDRTAGLAVKCHWVPRKFPYMTFFSPVSEETSFDFISSSSSFNSSTKNKRSFGVSKLYLYLELTVPQMSDCCLLGRLVSYRRYWQWFTLKTAMISSYFPFIVIDVVDSEPGYKDNTSDSAMIWCLFSIYSYRSFCLWWVQTQRVILETEITDLCLLFVVTKVIDDGPN